MPSILASLGLESVPLAHTTKRAFIVSPRSVRDVPQLLVLVPHGGGDGGLEHGQLVQVVLAGDGLAVGVDLLAAGVVAGRARSPSRRAAAGSRRPPRRRPRPGSGSSTRCRRRRRRARRCGCDSTPTSRRRAEVSRAENPPPMNSTSTVSLIGLAGDRSRRRRGRSRSSSSSPVEVGGTAPCPPAGRPDAGRAPRRSCRLISS